MRSIRLAGLLAALLPVSAFAVPVTYEFTGMLTGYTTDGDITDPPLPYGTEFVGSFTLEDSTPVSAADTGVTAYRNPITAASVRFGAGGSLGSHEYNGSTLAFSDVASSLVFLNDFEFMGDAPIDQFSLALSLGRQPGDPAGAFRSLQFWAGGYDTSLLPAGMSLNDPRLTATLISAGLVFTFYYEEFDADGNSVVFEAPSGVLTSLTQVPVGVPEPSTLALFAACVLGLGLRRRRAA